MLPIQELKNSWFDETVCIIGSGKSLDFIDPSFFQGKRLIGLNQVYRKIPQLDFTIATHLAAVSGALAHGQRVIASHWDLSPHTNLKSENKFESEDYWIFETDKPEDVIKSIDEMSEGSDKIVLGETVVISACHLAAYLGAKNIILCGIDFGAINGEYNFKGYYSDAPEHHNPIDQDKFTAYGRMILPILKDKIKKIYHANIYSLNPFTNPSLDGNVYTTSEKK